MQIAQWWLLGGLPCDVIDLSIGPTCICKQTLHISKAPLLVTPLMRFGDSGTHVTMM